jgi:plastocyanin
MRRELVILVVLFSVFLAIGCTGNKGQTATPTETPAVTPVNTSVTTPANESGASVETPQPTSKGEIVEVTIQGFAFNPASVEISSGDTVKWANMDSATHTIKGSTFESGSLAKGDTYEFTFTEPGVYDYICSIHPSMKGTVTVVEKK